MPKPQGNDLGMDLGDHCLAEIGLLQTNAARFEQKHWQDELAALAVAPRQRECRRNLAGGNFPHAAALEGSLDCHDHGRLAGELPARNDDAVIGLGHDPLQRQPGGFKPVEWAEQLAEGARVEKRPGSLAGPHLDDALARQETITALLGNRVVTVCRGHHDRTSSAACSSRSVTVPGVAPKSLTSSFATRSKRAKNRSSTAFQTWA